MDRRVAAQNTDGAIMLCPVCGFENLKGGDEICVNCGADLPGHDIPEPASSFHSRLLGEHLDDLGAPAPLVVGPDTPVDTAIARMQETGADCVLVTVDDRLVGIFTDRDAVVKAAGKHLDAFHVRDFMTADPVVLRSDDPIALAIHKMAVGGFRHIPIIEDGRPTGVVTARDVFDHLAETLGLTTIAVLAQDLIWQERLSRSVAEAGAEPARAATSRDFDHALDGAEFAIVDLTARAYDPLAAIERAVSVGARVLAVGQHDDVELRKRALARGADRVLAYRKLFEDGPATIEAWIGHVAGTGA